MILWKEENKEVKYLFSPPFCALLLYLVIEKYSKYTANDPQSDKGFPYCLLFLALPFILDENIRKNLDNSRTLNTWINSHPDCLIGFANKARNLVPITKNAIDFLSLEHYCNISNSKIYLINKLTSSKINKYKIKDSEIADCVNKANKVGVLFAKMHSERNIYVALGVLP